MYLEHFGLQEAPFSITPDTSFVCATQSHQEALNTLLVALQCGEGFLKVAGEVGTGKTLLCRRLLRSLQDGWVTAYLPNPCLDPDTLLLALAEELGLSDVADLDQYHLMRRINMALLNFAKGRKKVLLCIDEAQAIPLPTLEVLRLVSNLETEKRKLLQIVLFGQPELDAHLSDPSVRQLRQRITFHHRLRGLARNEVEIYLAHRMRVAGYRGDSLFTDRAVRGIYRASKGTPRLVNILAHKALLAVFGEGRQTVKFRHVRRAAADTEGARSVWW